MAKIAQQVTAKNCKKLQTTAKTLTPKNTNKNRKQLSSISTNSSLTETQSSLSTSEDAENISNKFNSNSNLNSDDDKYNDNDSQSYEDFFVDADDQFHLPSSPELQNNKFKLDTFNNKPSPPSLSLPNHQTLVNKTTSTSTMTNNKLLLENTYFVNGSGNSNGIGSNNCNVKTPDSNKQYETIRKLIYGSNEPKNDLRRQDLSVRLEETRKIFELALNNEFELAINLCAELAQDELYAALANATLSFLRAALTLEPNDLATALANINLSMTVSNYKRRHTNIMLRFWRRPDYNTFTDDEVHAELIHSESLVLLTLISFLVDQSLVCFVRGALRIRTCYQLFKECAYILSIRSNWSSENAKNHFSSGVKMGRGIFNLMMSYLPRRVLRFLEFVGFTGDRQSGIDDLECAIHSHDGLRSIFSSLVVLTYQSYVEIFFGLGEYDAPKTSKLLNASIGLFPTSAFYFLFSGKLNQNTGNLHKAVEDYHRCIETQSDWKQFHSLCHWELMWCYAMQMDWQSAANYANLLRQNSKWSPASYMYQYATFLYAKHIDDIIQFEPQQTITDNHLYISQTINKDNNKEREFEALRQLMHKVPDMRIRYAGKTIPAEKFAIVRSEKFFEQGDRLTLPALEFLYIWNMFATLKNNPIRVSSILKRIDIEIEIIENTITKNLSSNQQQTNSNNTFESNHNAATLANPSTYNADICLALLLKAICLKHLKRVEESESCLMRVMDLGANLVDTRDKFLVPHAAMELGLLKIDQQDYESASYWIKEAKSNYSGYLLETIVHFRLHAATWIIMEAQKNSNVNIINDDSNSVILNLLS